MIFDFDQQKTFAQSIDVDDIGNCALRCTNPAFMEFYVCTQTLMGVTYILKFGPILADVDALDEYFELSYKKVPYSEKTIKKEINLLLNDSKKAINQAEKIELADAMAMIPTADKFIPE